MTEINLLPWRETLRAQRKKEWLILLSVVILIAIGILGAVCTVLKTKITQMVTINKALQHKTELLADSTKKIKTIELQRSDLRAKATALKLLQLKRISVAPVLEQIVYQMPAGVHLMRLDKKGEQLKLEGIADSTVAVSVFVHNLAQSSWLKRPQLRQMETETSKVGNKVHRFEIVLGETLPEAMNSGTGESDGTQ